jgi:outer membrane murein-binding lipoprotein Lpp
MKRAAAFMLAFATLGLTACSGSSDTYVVEDSEKVIQLEEDLANATALIAQISEEMDALTSEVTTLKKSAQSNSELIDELTVEDELTEEPVPKVVDTFCHPGYFNVLSGRMDLGRLKGIQDDGTIVDLRFQPGGILVDC